MILNDNAIPQLLVISGSNLTIITGESYFNVSPISIMKNTPLCFPPHKFMWTFNNLYKLVIAPILLILGFVGNTIGYIFLKKLPKVSLSDICLKYMIKFSLLYSVFYTIWLFEKIRVEFYSRYTLDQSWMNYISHFELIMLKSSSKAGVFSFLVLLMDRHISLRYPFYHLTYKNLKSIRNLPLIFWILSIILCWSGYYWYEMDRCIIAIKFEHLYSLKSMFIITPDVTQAIYRSSDTLIFMCFYKQKRHEPFWLFCYDIFRELILSVIPGLLILFFGFHITISLYKFFKNRAIIQPGRYLIPLPQSLPSTTSGQDGNLPSKENVSTTKSISDIWKKDFMLNVSSLVYFVLYCLCHIPSLMTVVIRQHLENIRPYTKLNIDLFIESGYNLELFYFVTIVYITFFMDKRFRGFICKNKIR
ncbi:unnamed protein product [Gordionus sp. m RMFG-2023]